MVIWQYVLEIEENDKIKEKDILDFLKWFKNNHNEYKELFINNDGCYDFKEHFNFYINRENICYYCDGRIGRFDEERRHLYEYLLRYKDAFNDNIEEEIYNMMTLFDNIGWSFEWEVSDAYEDAEEAFKAGDDFGRFDIKACIRIYNELLNKDIEKQWSILYNEYITDKVDEYNKEYCFLLYLTKWLEKEYFKGRKVKNNELRDGEI